MSNDSAVEKTDDSRIEERTRESLERADIDPRRVSEKAYSFRMLLEAGLEESVAAHLRRRFSLPWSFETDGDLDKRSTEVRGLGEAEREWVVASADENWQAFENVSPPDREAESTEATERSWPRPTPVERVTGVGPDDADRLATAGITSAERLATIHAAEVADALELNVLHVRIWRHNARELLE
ncbi:hypothetical protein HALLA_08870 [Halostagnicola larsenii XH-48]|uniref:DUF7409 domain-containing protein n=1 Tax=Halostagnicola larsenii XH-48 TaxID=797299 RepID=W0JPQ4_9EURY|nr:hypothetical protein [Halostagnicola larsenii]AHF98962.1 hypothetical protein HALLA_08870 [Halostagnicola larsenii XH-48]